MSAPDRGQGAWPPPPGADAPPGSVYVHAPFCVRRCGYCDFAVQVRRTGDVAAWAAALEGELRALEREALFELPDRLRTLYVGGGTPSLLGAAAMVRLRDLLGRVRCSELSEWTAEANPESFTDEVARGWGSAGVDRVSLGVQSFHEGALRWMGRLHGPAGARGAVDAARRAGIENVSVDLLFALPQGIERSWSGDLDKALALAVPHLSLYGLTVEPGTPLGRAVRQGREAPAPESRYGDEYLEAAERLVREGYEHYEVSNFALPGMRARHNAVYWKGESYLGLGNSAHSYLHPLRRWNLRGWDAYEGVAREGRLPVEDQEVLDVGATRMEGVWLALRTAEGLPYPALSSRGHELVDRWVSRGWAVASAGRVRLTAPGWLLLDRLAVELDRLLEQEAGVADRPLRGTGVGGVPRLDAPVTGLDAGPSGRGLERAERGRP